MDYEIFLKNKTELFSGVGFDATDKHLTLETKLFAFQKHIVLKALKKGKYAIFADCGLGKTPMQLEWARAVVNKTNKPVLILAPLAVSGQTIQEGEKFNITVIRANTNDDIGQPAIYITNYEKLDKFDCDIFGGVVLDESSILKNFQGKTKKLIIDSFAKTQFKLACTATPSPNDVIELGNHSEFLNIMKSKEMTSMYFINDAFSKEIKISKWRLKKHAEKDFWTWVSSWSIMLSSPTDIGFEDKNYDLPELKISEIQIKSDKQNNGELFNSESVNATDFYNELRKTITIRCEQVSKIVNKSKENFIIWVKSNDEEKIIKKMIPDSVTVNGSDKPELKEKNLLDFANDKFRVLITKTKIAQFGLNYQNCRNQIFLSFDFSFEGLYQAIRRSWRFGQNKTVLITLVTIDTMGNVLQTIKLKQKRFNDMQKKMQIAMNKVFDKNFDYNNEEKIITGDNWTLINDDSIEYIKKMKNESIDFSFFSPPFSNLYMFSDDPRDVSNNINYKEFFKHFDFLIFELLRILKPGRLLSIHCSQLSTSKTNDGRFEIIDFRGDLIRAFQKHGFWFHAECVIWSDPKIVAQRTKARQLLHGTTKKDSCINRMGFPDYLITFKKPGENSEPVNHEKNGIPFDYWTKIAEPIWPEGEILRSDVLRIKDAKGHNDEKHMTPTQKEPIKRLLELYTNPGDIVFSPFSGIGTEGVVSIENNRKYIGIELKKSYFDVAVRNLEIATQIAGQGNLFKTG